MSDNNTTQPDGGGATGTQIPDALLEANPGIKAKNFASVEALAQSYLALEKTFGKKGAEIDTLKKQLAGGQTFDPSGVEVPDVMRPYIEKYAELGIKEDAAKILAADEAARDSQINGLKLSQRNLELGAEWGAQTQQRVDAVTEWASANLDANTAAAMTGDAAGMRNLRILMENSMGGTVTTPGALPPEGPAGRIDVLKKERDAIYKAGNHTTDWTAQQRLNEIMAEMVDLQS